MYNIHKKLVKFGRVAFELCERTDRQTDRQTYILITILRTHPGGGEVTTPNRAIILIFSVIPGTLRSTRQCAKLTGVSGGSRWCYIRRDDGVSSPRQARLQSVGDGGTPYLCLSELLRAVSYFLASSFVIVTTTTLAEARCHLPSQVRRFHVVFALSFVIDCLLRCETVLQERRGNGLCNFFSFPKFLNRPITDTNTA